MHSDFDAEMERQDKRLDDRIFQTPVVNSLSDIKRILSILDPVRSVDRSVHVATVMDGEASDGKAARFSVRGDAKQQSQRSILLDAFSSLQRRMDAEQRMAADVQPISVNGRTMRPATNRTASHFVALDRILERWLGASRSGLYICWDIADGRYLYDIFQHKLFRDKNATASKNDS